MRKTYESVVGLLSTKPNISELRKDHQGFIDRGYLLGVTAPRLVLLLWSIVKYDSCRLAYLFSLDAKYVKRMLS
jgi:hypothetical protein